MEKAPDSADDDEAGASEQDDGRNETTDNRITDIAISVLTVGSFAAIALKRVGNTNTDCVTKIMDSVRSNSNAIREEAAEELEDGKSKVKQKGNKDFPRTGVLVVIIGVFVVFGHLMYS